MTRYRRMLPALAVVSAFALSVTACSGGRKDTSSSAGVAAGKADTPKYTVAMITHSPPGDTFWDIIQKGAKAAAAKDNITFQYSSDGDATKQSVLIQNAIDRKVNGIALTDPNTAALAPVIKKAVAAGIPVVMLNAGFDDWQKLGALSYYGQDESFSGQSAGARLTSEGAKKVLCVEQAQGQSQLEARCSGVAKGFTGGTTEKLYVNGTDLPSVRSTISAKLQQDKNIDYVMTLGAPIALTAVDSVKDAGSKAKIVTFDTNPDLAKAVQAGTVQWAVDQQPYLQGYGAIDQIWLYLVNGNVVGGGKPVLTGPSFIDKANIDRVLKFALAGTR